MFGKKLLPITFVKMLRYQGIAKVSILERI